MIGGVDWFTPQVRALEAAISLAHGAPVYFLVAVAWWRLVRGKMP